MGFIRGAAITLFSIFLIISLLLMNLSLIISSSLNYDTLQPVLRDSAGEIFRGFIQGGSIFSDEEKPYMESYCAIYNYAPYSFSYENYTFTIPCEVVEQGEDAIVNYGADNFIPQIYYTQYNCELWDCVKGSSVPLVLISEKSRDYWAAKFLLLAALSFIIFALIFLISKNKSTTFIVTGVLLILSALPFRGLDWILGLMSNNLSSILALFFTKAYSIFFIMLILGLAFIVAGIICKIFGWKMKFTKDEEELSKDKKDSEKQKTKQAK